MFSLKSVHQHIAECMLEARRMNFTEIKQAGNTRFIFLDALELVEIMFPQSGAIIVMDLCILTTIYMRGPEVSLLCMSMGA